MIRKTLLALALSVWPAISYAADDPFVFVVGTNPWYDMAIARPMDKQVDGVTAAAIDAYQGAEGEDKICYIQGLSRQSYIGLTRHAHETVEQFFTGFGYSFTAQHPARADVTVRAVIIERCSGARSVGALLYDANKIVRYLTSFAIEENTSNLAFLWVSDGDLAISRCTECGDRTLILYDERRNKFYSEYAGD